MSADKPFKPMLAGNFDPALIRFPILASPKLDGIRTLAMNGKPMSRSMKVLPNAHVQKFFARHAEALEGLDGELIVGSPTAEDVYRTTTAHVMSHYRVFDFTFVVFDRWARASSYADASEYLETQRGYLPPGTMILPQKRIMDVAALEAYEEWALNEGYEGVMLRDPTSLYKQGRSSTKEGILLKVKRHEQDEAVVIGFEEEMENQNEALKNELGRTHRSTAQAGLVGKGTMGALVVRGLNGPFAGVEFNIGTGFNAADRASLWQGRDALAGRIVTFKHFPIGVKDAPRHPVFVGFRSSIDMAA